MNKETGAAMKNEAGAEMTADEAKQKVLRVHPRAEARKPRGGNIGVCIVLPSGKPISHTWATGPLAWIDAASKLPTPIPTPASEPFEDNFTEAAAFAGIAFSQGCQFWMKMNHLTGNGPAPGFLPAPPSTEESGEPTFEFHGMRPEKLIERAVRSARDRKSRKGEKHPRWTAVMDCFALGSGYSMDLCRKFGLDPDEEVKR